jgi:hypothetical protein
MVVRHTPGAEAPFSFATEERPKAEALGYPEATARAKAKSRSPSGMTNKKGNSNGKSRSPSGMINKKCNDNGKSRSLWG